MLAGHQNPVERNPPFSTLVLLWVLRVWILFRYILLLSRLMQFLNGFMTITVGSGCFLLKDRNTSTYPQLMSQGQ